MYNTDRNEVPGDDAIVESDYIMYPNLKKYLVFTAPKGGPFSAGGSKLLSVVIQ